ncbi:MAG: thiol-disulfide oxidoreductase DCC family protein [Salibacteraceae bacterium]
MKTPDHYLLLFDGACPFCRWYSLQFVNWKFLAPESRQTLQSALSSNPGIIPDPERARHEIPLLDRQTGRVLYGIDALSAILAYRWNWIRIPVQWKWVRWILQQLYMFISFNRRIIAGERLQSGACECGPTRHPGYQWTFIVVMALTSVFLSLWFGHITAPVIQGFFPSFLPIHTLLLVGTGWALQGLAIWFTTPKKRLAYIGTLSTLAFTGLLVLIGVAIPLFSLFPATLVWGCMNLLISVSASFIFMWSQHRKRLRSLCLNQTWHLTWTFNLWLSLFGWVGLLFL